MALTVYPDRLRRDIAAAVSNAAAGSKLNAGYEVVRSNFSSGTLQLIRSGVIVYSAAAVTPVITTSKLLIGKTTAAATILDDADIDTGTWKVRLENGSKYIEGTVTKTGGSGPFYLTTDLDDEAGLSIGSLYFTLPTAIDNTGTSSGTSGNYSYQTLIDDMGYNDADPAVMINTPNWGTRLSGGYTSNDNASGATKIAPWYEICPVNRTTAYPAAPNSRMEFRNLRLLVRRNGSWQILAWARNLGTEYWAHSWYDKRGYDINTNPATGQAYGTENRFATSIPGGFAFKMDEFRKDPYWVNHGYPSAQFSVPLNYSEGVPICVQAECRIAMIDTNGVDDRGNVPLLCHVACDWYGSGGWQGPSHQGKFKRVTNNWQIFTGTNITTVKSVQTYPGQLTASQLLANPPTMVFA